MAEIVAPMPEQIERAVVALRAGRLIGLPTETVYGLAADATNPDAVARIFATKGRPSDHPVIVHVASADALDDWAHSVPDAARALAQRCWPGPLTLVVPRAAHVHDAITGGQPTIALRCPAHPVAQAVLRALSSRQRPAGLAAPSANRYGRISPTQARHVADDHPHLDLLILDGGECMYGIESTIVDATRMSTDGLVVLRPGAVTLDALERATRMPVRLRERHDAARAPRVSGDLASHYAPRKPLALMSRESIERIAPEQAGRCALLAFGHVPEAGWAWSHAATVDAPTYAHGLYAWLRDMDGSSAQRLIVERLPDDAAWVALHDRLQRATTR